MNDLRGMTNAGMGSEGAAGLQQKQPPGETEKGMDCLTADIGNLRGCVNALIDKLQPILRPECEAKQVNGTADPHPERSPLAIEIYGRASEVSEIRLRLLDALERLDI